ncbi:MAG TPA: SBBP repeat-containing protein [Verrucomicrobiae bacterium]|jgi:sugar lactone lactonase YvrE
MGLIRKVFLCPAAACQDAWLQSFARDCFRLIILPILLMAGALQAQLIDVDFNNNSYGVANGIGPSVGPTMSGAAVLGTAGDQWNGISVNSGSGISLTYANGSASAVTMTFTSGGGYDAKNYNGFTTPFASTSYDALMEDYLFNGSIPQTVTLSGLATNATYNLVLYNAADNGSGAAGRTTSFTVNGNTRNSTWNASSSTLIAGIDYVEFTSALSDGSGKLVITYNGSPEGDIDGFQIQSLFPPTPTVTITNPVAGTFFPTGGSYLEAPANVSIAASASVSSGTVTNVQFFTNGISIGSVLASPFSLTVSNLAVGTYVLTAVATASGISATSSVVNISVVGPATAQANNPSAYTWTTIAGYPGVGSADGIGSAAKFNNPSDTAVDTNGNIYVADTENYTIRKLSAAGVVSTLVGLAGFSGTVDGTNSAARFQSPVGITVDGGGNLYVTDDDAVRKITPVGTNWVTSTIAGLAGNAGSVDGTNNNTRFGSLSCLTVDSATNLYVVDDGPFSSGSTHTNAIRKITPVGTNWVVTTISGTNFFNSGSSASYGGPAGIARDGAGNLYVTDIHFCSIREMVPTGTNWVVTTIAGPATNIQAFPLDGFPSSGDTDGTNNLASFDNPDGIAVDSAGNLYVADTGNDSIRKIIPIGTNWVVTTFAGSNDFNVGSADGTGIAARFYQPEGISVDSAGNLYVADTVNQAIRKVTSAAVVSTLAGSSGSAGSANGTAGAARFNQPEGVAVDDAGNLYVADTYNNSIRKITSAGVVSTVAGGTYGLADGAGSSAQFNTPRSVAVDSAGNLYVADTGNESIRKITPAGLVTTIAGGAGGSIDGTGIAVDSAGNVYVADSGSNTVRKLTPVGSNWVMTTIAGLAGNAGNVDGTNGSARFNYLYGLTLDSATNLYVGDFNSSTETATIRKISPVGTNWVVNTIIVGSLDGSYFSIEDIYPNASDNIAVDGAGNLYVADFFNLIHKLTPAGNGWMAASIGGGGILAPHSNVDGAGSDARFNEPSGVAVDSLGNVYVADTQNNTIRKGVFTAYAPVNEAAYTAPAMTGSLTVTLLPSEASGQWRLPWEKIWHNSGEVVSNLAQDNYTIEFQNVPGYLVIQTNFTVSVINGTTISVTNQYYPTLDDGSTNSIGSLTVDLGPNLVTGAGWRFLGESSWRAPGSTATNLLSGIDFIEYEPVTNYTQPPSQEVQIYAGLPTIISANYLLASSAPAGVLWPFPVPVGEINDEADYPFGFNGQLQSDVGYGSGVAVQTNVVLTAAHMVFNDQTLSYVSQVYWYFRQETGVSSPEPQAARGWYVLSGYAAQRTNDLQSGLVGPNQSTPQSRNLDVAALYFLLPVAGGGYGGYLPSDQSPNPWLTGSSLKMLVGYPVDGSEFGNSSIVPGEMYQTQPQPYPLSLATDPVTGQQVYLTSVPPSFLGYPGNSGGPVYAQYNGYYYPAGVYLGTLYSGITPIASLVRAIDSSVVNLITNAAVLGDDGTNHNGGGVITIVPNQAITSANPGYLQFVLGPPSAVTAGAGWKLSGDSAYGTASNYVRAVTSTNVTVLFHPLPGWNSPGNQAVAVLPNQITSYSASYTVINPLLTINGTTGFGITGTTGTVYVIQKSSSLTAGIWTPVSTNTITSSGFNLVLPNPLTNGSAVFYRAVWLP